MVRYLRAANVVDGELDLSDVKEMNFTPCVQQFFSLQEGDILVTEGSGSLRTVGASAVWRNDLPGPVCFQNTLLRIRPRSCDTDPKFLAWWCRFAYVDGLFASIGAGANIFHLSAERVRALPVRCPQRPEQKLISEFLYTETTRVGALITKKRQMARLLAKKRSAKISQLLWFNVTYERVRLHHLAGRPTSGNRDHGSFVFANTGVPCLRGLNVKPARIDRQNLLCIDEVTSRGHSNTVLRSDDLVIVRSGFAGAAALVPPDLDGCNCVDLVLVRKCSTLIPKYLEYVVNSGEAQEQVRQKSSGALLSHFNAVDAGNLIIPYRKVSQQEAIVVELDRACSKIDQTMDLIQGQIMLLQERRQALITAAVTGEMDVPGVPA